MRRASALIAITALLAAPAAVFAAEPFTADLTGGAEVPPVDTDATGTATVTISDDASSISYEVTFEGLSGDAVGAHIHFGGPDVAGPVIIPFEHGPSPFSGTFSEGDYTAPDDANAPQTWDEALEAIRAGDTYVNVHTEMNPGGEIRGPLRAVPDTAAAEEAPSPVTTGASLALVLLAGAVAFVIGLRRLSFRRA